MPTKQTINCETGQVEEVEMGGEELAAHEALLAATSVPQPPTRDERLLDAVEQAKAAVEGGAFTAQQAATLSAVFDGLGAAITGGQP